MTITPTSTTHHWDAESYHRNSSAQQEAATPLFHSIKLNGNEKILDVGCGDGKITAQIATKVPNGTVLGTDISEEMIRFAKTRFSKISNLQFSVQDAQQLNIQDKFDVIFSSFALQWVKNIDVFFDRAKTLLQPSALLVATIPLGVSDALEQSLATIVSSPKWAHYFEGFSSGWHFKTADQYQELLTNHQFETIKFNLIRQEKMFSSRELLEQYVNQWLTYLNPIPEGLKNDFFDELMGLYFNLEPLDEEGRAYLRFARVDFIARKQLNA